jgi:hypothetical protein
VRSELPEYLLRRTGPYTDQIIHLADVGGSRYWLVFKFPYREYFLLEGNRLILSDEETPPGGERRRYQITWERISQ